VSRRALNLRRAPIPAAIVVLAALVAAAPGAGAPPSLKQKEHQAQQVLGEVNALDIQLGRIGEQLNGAQYDLSQVRKREGATRRSLAKARKRYAIAEQRVEQRLVTLYESDTPSTADAILGATSLSAILDRLQLVQAASALDARLARDAKLRRLQLAQKEQALVTERQRAAAAVAAIAAHRRTLNAELGQRRVLLSSIQGEVKHLQAQARARQARLAAEARARLAAELKAREEKAAAERAAAAKAAAARRRVVQPPPVTTTVTTATTATTPSTTTDAATTDAVTTTATTTASAPPPPPAPTAAGHPEAASIAMKYLGVPYVFGGGTPAGFDCSGLVMYVYAQLGIQLPHYAAAQYGYGVAVPRADLQPGDLVFFDALGHVGIWIGGGQFIDAPHTGSFVSIETMSGWYASHYVGARRI